ncbi:MAG: Bacteriophage Lambda NinG protein [Brevundimonas sp.]|nr:Bacteriophage Lambda NinG protein [Brevundimonas sp.]
MSAPSKTKTPEIGGIKMPRKKKTPRASAKTKAWDAFSLYIRTRDCIRFTGDPEQGICVTCKTPKPKKELQAGHFVGGRGNAVLFNEQIVYSQCGYCNQKPPMCLGGNYALYTLSMFDEGYTRVEIEAFLALKNTTKQYKLNDFIEIRAKYETKTKGLLSRVQTD